MFMYPSTDWREPDPTYLDLEYMMSQKEMVTFVYNARVQFDSDWISNNFTQETTGVPRISLGLVLFGAIAVG